MRRLLWLGLGGVILGASTGVGAALGQMTPHWTDANDSNVEAMLHEWIWSNVAETRRRAKGFLNDEGLPLSRKARLQAEPRAFRRPITGGPAPLLLTASHCWVARGALDGDVLLRALQFG